MEQPTTLPLPVRTLIIPGNSKKIYFERVSNVITQNSWFEMTFSDAEMANVYPSLSAELCYEDGTPLSDDDSSFCSFSLEGGEQLAEAIQFSQKALPKTDLKHIIQILCGQAVDIHTTTDSHIYCTLIGLDEAEEKRDVKDNSTPPSVLHFLKDDGSISSIQTFEISGITPTDKEVGQSFRQIITNNMRTLTRPNWKVLVYANLTRSKRYCVMVKYTLVPLGITDRSVLHRITLKGALPEVKTAVLDTFLLVSNNTNQHWQNVQIKSSFTDTSNHTVNILSGQSALAPCGNSLTLPALVTCAHSYSWSLELQHNKPGKTLLPGVCTVIHEEQQIALQTNFSPNSHYISIPLSVHLDCTTQMKLSTTRTRDKQAIVSTTTAIRRVVMTDLCKSTMTYTLTNNTDNTVTFMARELNNTKSTTAERRENGNLYHTVKPNSVQTFKVVTETICTVPTTLQFQIYDIESWKYHFNLTEEQESMLLQVIDTNTQRSKAQQEHLAAHRVYQTCKDNKMEISIREMQALVERGISAEARIKEANQKITFLLSRLHNKFTLAERHLQKEKSEENLTTVNSFALPAVSLAQLPSTSSIWESKSLFGASQPPQATGFSFGSGNTNTTPTFGAGFGATPAQSTGFSLGGQSNSFGSGFGTTTPADQPTGFSFGAAASAQPSNSGFLFGASSLPTSSGLFGSSSAQPSFGFGSSNVDSNNYENSGLVKPSGNNAADTTFGTAPTSNYSERVDDDYPPFSTSTTESHSFGTASAFTRPTNTINQPSSGVIFGNVTHNDSLANANDNNNAQSSSSSSGFSFAPTSQAIPSANIPTNTETAPLSFNFSPASPVNNTENEPVINPFVGNFQPIATQNATNAFDNAQPTTTQNTGFSFGRPAAPATQNTGFSFGAPAAPVTHTGAFIFEVSETSKVPLGNAPAQPTTTQNTGFSFGAPAAPATRTGVFSSPNAAPHSQPLFGGNSGGTSFGALPQTGAFMFSPPSTVTGETIVAVTANNETQSFEELRLNESKPL